MSAAAVIVAGPPAPIPDKPYSPEPYPASINVQALVELIGETLRQGIAAAAAEPPAEYKPDDILRTDDVARLLHIERQCVAMMASRYPFLKSISRGTWMYQQVIIWKAFKVGMPLEEANAEWERFRAATRRKARVEPPADGKRRK